LPDSLKHFEGFFRKVKEREKVYKFMMNKKRGLFLSKLFLILVLTGNISITAQNGETPKSGGGGSNSNPKTNVSKPGANVLDARRWNLIEMGGAKVESSKAFVEFVAAEKRFAGNAGCNRMFGKFEMNGDKIKISGIGTTKMFCSAKGVMKLESNFVKALEQTTRYKQKGETLNLFAGNRLILKFSGAAKTVSDGENSNAAGLEDKKWILTSIAGKSLPKIETVPFLVFDKQKQSAGGDSGCNVFGGSYKTEGAKIGITEIISTQRACIEDERMNIEREFFGNLQKATRFEIKAGKLNLYEGDTPLLTFNAVAKS